MRHKSDEELMVKSIVEIPEVVRPIVAIKDYNRFSDIDDRITLLDKIDDSVSGPIGWLLSKFGYARVPISYYVKNGSIFVKKYKIMRRNSCK